MQENWNPGRYINIYEIEMDRHNRDSMFRKLRTLDPFVYDLRIQTHRIELSYFFQLNRNTASIMGKNCFISNINYLQNIQSFDYSLYLIEDERYWEAHEVLENSWRNSTGIEKTTYQYIILLCAAGVHMQRGHDSVCKNIISRAGKMNTMDIIGNLDISNIKKEKFSNPYYELSILIRHSIR
jgi:hypothetical protein